MNFQILSIILSTLAVTCVMLDTSHSTKTYSFAYSSMTTFFPSFPPKATTTAGATTIMVPTAFPAVKPNIGNAVYIFSFEVKIKGTYSHITNDKQQYQEFEDSLNSTLFEHIFGSIPEVSLSFTLRQGSIMASVESIIVKKDLKNIMNITDVLQTITNNTEKNAHKINTTQGRINDLEMFTNDFQRAYENLTLMLEIDPCSIESNVCDKSYIYTCADSKNTYSGKCIHRCETEPDLCGENGECFYDLVNQITACKCKTASFIVYYGDRCQKSTATKEFILGLSVGGGVGTILIQFVIIICLCIRRGENKNRNKSRHGKSKRDLPRNDVDLKDIGFRSRIQKTGHLHWRHHRSPGQINRANEPVFTRSGRGGHPTHLPDESEQVTSSRSEVYYSSIDPSADYSIIRPHTTSKTNDVYNYIYFDNTPESHRGTSRP